VFWGGKLLLLKKHKMDAIRILDRHKKTITGDKEVFFILANILLLRRANTKRLQESLKFDSDKRLELRLIELLKSGYLEQEADDWFLTEFSEKMLNKLGVAEGIKNSLLNNLNIGDEDKTFFSSYFEFVESSDEESQDVVNFLRTLNQTNSVWGKYLERTKLEEFTKRCLYAFILSSNPSSFSINNSLFFDELLNYHEINQTRYWKKLSNMKNLKIIILSSCNSSLEDFKTSNESHFRTITQEKFNNLNDFNFYFNVQRHCNAIYNKKADKHLMSFFKSFSHFESPLEKEKDLYSDLFLGLNTSIGALSATVPIVTSLVTFIVNFYETLIGSFGSINEMKIKMLSEETKKQEKSIKSIVYSEIIQNHKLNIDLIRKKIEEFENK